MDVPSLQCLNKYSRSKHFRLVDVICDDGLNCRIPHMGNSVDHRVGGSSRHGAKDVSEGEDWPIIADNTEVGVFGIGKNTVGDELSSNNSILASLVGHRGRLLKESGQEGDLVTTCIHSEYSNRPLPLKDALGR